MYVCMYVYLYKHSIHVNLGEKSLDEC